MKIKILGSGCPTCKELYETVLKAVSDNKDITVEYIADITALLEAGIMGSPALLIDDKVISVGRLPSVEEIKEYIVNFNKVKVSSGSTCSCGGRC